MSGTREMIVSEKAEDPVIALKRKKLETIERMALRFKRIDIKFLSIPSKEESSRPAFAILPLEIYEAGASCTFSGYGSGYSWTTGVGSSANNFVDVFRQSTDLFDTCTASPKSPPTDEAQAIAAEVKGDFDRIMVAWEADWSRNDGDPLMIGEIDGIWFLLAKWDVTSLESYVAAS